MKELKPKYDFKEVENGKYDFWLKGGYFTAGDKSKEPFTIVIPPPNVTGKLHLGHSWDTTLQDIIIRRKRMQGYDALWLPGMDHAGIATQAKVDAKLKEQGISRYDLGREKFLEVAWQWKHEYANFIHSQWAALGLSLDYTKERFTLDEGLNKAVNYVFITLYNKGLLYQGERIINWDCQAKTALSNIEVEHTDDEGAFYHYNYPLTDGSGFVEIATTRPETMFADQAVMVHPKDERYKNIVGKKVRIPLTDIEIPVIADEYVDMEFGTGCVKVTPAHDPNDFEVGKRHNLPMPLCMNDDGTMNSMAGKYEGLDRFVCRERIVEDLKKEGLYVRTEPIVHSVGHSERTGVVVEPRLSKQWFVKMDVLAKQVLENDEYRFVPARFKQTLEHWLDPDSIQDWCVSRQLWWGHRIPAWYKDNEVKVQVECPGDGWIQDEDVLDTWFSSALWPFSTLGWPEQTEDFKHYYPTSTLVTGYDIIPFWVMRMMFSGIEQTGEVPFNTVLIHGLVRDPQGRKMSKSLGNGVDPLEVIGEYGADALRFSLATGNSPGNDMRYIPERVEASRNFANKLWNAARFILMNLENDQVIPLDKNSLALEDKWIISKFNTLCKDVTENLDRFELGMAVGKLYDFIWDVFCDWYIEICKSRLSGDDIKAKDTARSVLTFVFSKTLALLHPFMPFITEEIWQSIPHCGEALMVSQYPKYSDEFAFAKEEEEFEKIMAVIKAVRNRRAEMNVPPSKKATVQIQTDFKDTFSAGTNYICRLAYASDVEIGSSFEAEGAVRVVTDCAVVYMPMKELVDVTAEIERLNKDMEKAVIDKEFFEKKLNNAGFMAKAPQNVVEQQRQGLKKALDKIKIIEDSIKELKNM